MNLFIVFVPLGLLVASALAAFLVGRFASPTSGQVLSARGSEQALAHELPYWAILDEGGLGLAVGVDLTYSVFYRLRGIDVDCLDAEALAQLSSSLHGILQNLQPGVVLEFHHSTDGDIAEPLSAYLTNAEGTTGIGRHLVESKATDLKGSPALRRSTLILGVSVPRSSTTGAGLLGFARKFPSFSVHP
jgi:hypothetical protein